METEQFDQPHSFFYDVIEFIIILLYIAVPVALYSVLYWILTPYRESDTWGIQFLAALAYCWTFAFIPYMFRKAKQHSARLLTNKRVHNQHVDPTVKRPNESSND